MVASPVVTELRFGSAEWTDAVELRRAVLRTPLGLDYGADDLAAEADQVHLGLWLEDRLAGVVLLVTPDAKRTGQVRQMAVPDAHRGRGFGRALMLHAHDTLRRLDADSVRLSARASAIGFYERMGYVAGGPPQVLVGLPHRAMRCTL